MNNILIGGPRKEIGKLFELLLWQPDRNFSTVYSLDKCIKQAKFANPDLLIVDGAIDTPERCFNALVELKESPETADIPIVLLTDPARDGEERARLMLVADEQIPEPFNPGEIKSITEQFI
jgi:DNA-binding response OmpR family regulator